ncbi:hypothetical protein GALL_28620 [mine drainage metagenome]|uniref:Uncharacterized protein n=1 Tax=mine drainage metagenome TaxID=410659 RepID=A0A1J5T858_9ZZZZ
MTNRVTPLILHEDAFYEFFVPYRHPKSSHDIWGGHGLETFGSDLELVRSLDEDHVWTVVESGCDDDLWITPGVHYVNRICYLVTEKAHHGLIVDFRVPHNLRSLTPLGLKRQVNRIRRSLNQLKLDSAT